MTAKSEDATRQHPTSSPKTVIQMHPKTDAMEPIHLGKSEKQLVVETAMGDDTIDDADTWPTCSASTKSLRTTNPIRALVDPIFQSIQSGHDRGDHKDPISLALGDPTVGGDLPPCQVALDAVVQAVRSKDHAAGYVNACGIDEARHAIARHHSYVEHAINATNVIVASGCSGCLELVLSSLLDPGTALLVPQPGFPLYQVIAESHGASVVHYRLDPDNNWECDLDHLEQLMEKQASSTPTNHRSIRGLLLNNPSNPTGAVFSRSHLQDVVAFCDKHRLVLVADEVYGDLTFDSSDDGRENNNSFYPAAKVAAQCGQRVPVITTSGLAKQYLLPGWRVGWIVFHDNNFGSLAPVEAGAKRLAQVVLGASHLVQRVIPKLLSPDDPIQMEDWKENLRLTLAHQATFLCRKLSACHGLQVLPPQGAMYSMVRLDLSQLDVMDDLDFSSCLLEEENVIILPGTAFGCPNSFRVVFCSNETVLEEAAQRIHNFCQRHAK